jgi:hypothetical protein
MELDASLSWLALAPGLASRLSARVLRKFGSPERVFERRCRHSNPASFRQQSRRPSLRRNLSRAPKKNWMAFERLPSAAS